MIDAMRNGARKTQWIFRTIDVGASGIEAACELSSLRFCVGWPLVSLFAVCAGSDAGSSHADARRGDPDDTQCRPLPEVLMLDLGDRDIVMLTKPILEAPEHLTLPLEGGHSGKVKPDDTQADVDRRPIDLAAHDQRLLAATLSIRNASMMSPTLTSLKFASPMPHS